jgi:hypothetical protein
MAQWADIDRIDTYEHAVQVVLEGIGMRVDPRKVLWCNYPCITLERDELEEKVRKDTKKLEREIENDLCQSRLWYVGVPRFKLVRRGIAHFACDIDLYYVACDTTSDYVFTWYGKLIPKADRFECPLSLIEPLLNALEHNEIELDNAIIIERTPSYGIYAFLGREWKIPDAFLGFLWALKDKGRGFEGLLDPVSCSVMDKFAKELPCPETPKIANGSYEEIVDALRSLGWKKTDAEDRARQVLEKHPGVPLEEKIKYALSG